MTPIFRLLATLTLGAAALPAASARAAGDFDAKVPPDFQLVVADQRQQLQVAFAASGEQKKLPFKVKFADFRGGPAILEAFRGGALDLAIVGDAPPVQAHVSGYPLPIVGAKLTDAPTYRYALKPGSDIRKLGDLRGKKIAYAEGTAVQPFVLATLQKAGLTKKDVTLVPLRIVDFTDAVRTGEVDIAPMNEPPFSRYLTSFKKDGAQALDLGAQEGLPRNLNYLYASQTSLRDPVRTAAIAAFVRHWAKAVQWTEANPEAWIKAYYVKSQNLPADVGATVHASQGKSSFPALSAVVPRQQHIIDLIHAAGEIPKRLEAKEEFDFRFDQIGAQAAKSDL
ncbi:Putative aliphatic sulfonates-binding protein precursor [Pigmentiphaga humi]|uniref:Aliphatic sulfonates-binding protein n=1 Tax=Pigmentiphaga humi TaxID=2478468 RepID=A0A3P4B3V1_9BURK|nr:ABC transporter substrate-binding protein [Pigmentiphaga humi]VCU70308.1 Putative aliphatic sulfonates-binding protein precursor [Pigmentiphaga humi]